MSQTTAAPSASGHRPSGLDQLIALAAAQPLAPACDHFYFLRHGQTGRNAQRIFQATDEPLSELGLQQAALTWAQGYFHARSGKTTDELLSETDTAWDFDSLSGYLVQFCADNPEAQVPDAVASLWEALAGT